MAFPPGHPHHALAAIHAGVSTDELYRSPMYSGLSSPPTGHFLPPIQYLPTEYPLRNAPSFPPQGFPLSAGNYSQLPFGFPGPGVQELDDKLFSPRTLAGDQSWERLEGGEANLRPPMQATSGMNNGCTWLAPHRLPSTDSHPVTIDFPPKPLSVLSHPSSTTEADQTWIHLRLRCHVI